ncbi:gamma-glutamyl hydrolase-like isoform X1 [Amphiura filiformis]|uniref:gamma-glutamyl hydrolase-like isoform X1 n=1 Tax=Amphiura filiformis TaxID=82378 RepID=UPI003B20DF12
MIIRDNLIVISLVILIGALFLHCDARGTVVNDRPIIGILSQTEWNDQLIKHGDAYLAASYVKYIESAGARVAPVFVNQTQLYYNKIFNSVNGLLLPGGGQLDLLDSGYGRAARYFYDMAMKSYDAGNYFPIWGSCFGFEILSMLTAGKDLRTSTKAIDISYPLNISKDYKSSHLMKDIPNDILNTLTTVNMTFNYHHWGISPTNFTKSEELKNFYRILSTNVDENGVEFISTMEAYNYPIYAIMWHAEKNQFEWNPHKEFRLDHSLEAIQAVQYFANFFVNESRKNSHKFSSEEEERKHLMYNFTPVYTADVVSYEQCYFFQTCSGIR